MPIPNPDSFKIAVHENCVDLVQEQLDTIQSSLGQLMDAKRNETKSSAGDKYETGMAMIQNQEELFKRQQLEARKRMRVLESIDPSAANNRIDNGSLVSLSTGLFYIAIAIGKVNVANQDLYVISKQSPLGLLLKGKQAGDTILLNDKKISIESVN